MAIDIVEKVTQGELMVLGVCGVAVSHGFQDFGDLVQQLRDGFLQPFSDQIFEILRATVSHALGDTSLGILAETAPTGGYGTQVQHHSFAPFQKEVTHQIPVFFSHSITTSFEKKKDIN